MFGMFGMCKITLDNSSCLSPFHGCPAFERGFFSGATSGILSTMISERGFSLSNPQ